MDTDHREHSVMVWGEPHIVTVYRKSETVYEAVGNYMCKSICVNDQSEGAAIKRWREAAAGVSPSEQLTRGARVIMGQGKADMLLHCKCPLMTQSGHHGSPRPIGAHCSAGLRFQILSIRRAGCIQRILTLINED